MKTVIVTSNVGEELQIKAPADKTMAIDTGLLASGILSIGEYGTSGIKIAAFKDWSSARFVDDDAGYTFAVINPF